MELKEQPEKLVSLYQLTFPNEQDELISFINFLQNHSGKQLFDRKNFDGHITASAFIINAREDSILLLQHKNLDKWLQPGGHVDEADETIFLAAIRETVEETGIPVGDIEEVEPFGKNAIFDIDSHPIPENKLKNEPAHIHHDIRFLLKYKRAEKLLINKNEATAFKWILIDELLNDEIFSGVAAKIKAALKQTSTPLITERLV